MSNRIPKFSIDLIVRSLGRPVILISKTGSQYKGIFVHYNPVDDSITLSNVKQQKRGGDCRRFFGCYQTVKFDSNQISDFKVLTNGRYVPERLASFNLTTPVPNQASLDEESRVPEELPEATLQTFMVKFGSFDPIPLKLHSIQAENSAPYLEAPNSIQTENSTSITTPVSRGQNSIHPLTSSSFPVISNSGTQVADRMILPTMSGGSGGTVTFSSNFDGGMMSSVPGDSVSISVPNVGLHKAITSAGEKIEGHAPGKGGTKEGVSSADHRHGKAATSAEGTNPECLHGIASSEESNIDPSVVTTRAC